MCVSTASRCSASSAGADPPVELDSSSRDDVRTERAAITQSVGLSWPPDRRWLSAGRLGWHQLWERAVEEHILHHHKLPHGVRLQRLGAFSMDRGPLEMLVQIVHASTTDAILREQPWPEHIHHVTSENGWANTTMIPQWTT